MRILVLFMLCILLGNTTQAQSRLQKEVSRILAQQDQAWNRGDLDGFMETYWKNDSLMFIGKSGVTYGWTNTLNQYKKSYPDTASMGRLDFTLIQVKRLSPRYCTVTGKWHLSRSKGDLQGHFTLLMRKIKGVWRIVSDHSS